MTAQQQPTVQYPSTASALAIAGGVLMIVSGLLIIAVSIYVLPALNSFIGENVRFVTSGNSTTAIYFNGTTHTFNGAFPFNSGTFPSFVSGITGLVGAFGLFSGVLVLISGVMLRTNPSQSSIWGVLILVFSVLSFFGAGGFIVGAVLGIIGSIMALTWKPSSTTA
jgi:hypothetical protein